MSGRGRALAWSALFLGGGLALSVLLIGVLPSGESGGAGDDPRLLAGVQSAVLIAVFALLTWAIGRRRLGVTSRDLGLVPAAPGVRGFGLGFGLGLGLGVAALVAAVPAGGAGWSLDGGSVGEWLGALLVTGAVLLPAAFAEELIFRGAPLVALGRAFGRGPALVGLSVLFGLAHLLNPAVTPLGIANIVLAGIFLGVAFYTRGGLWTATGAHLGWNLSLAGLAAPVSGLPIPMPLLDYAPGAPAWLTGGPFGPEGGLLATFTLLAGCAAAGRRMTQETTS